MTTFDARQICFVVGLVVGVLVVTDIRIRHGLTPNWTAAFFGFLFGGIVVWTLADSIVALQKPEEFSHYSNSKEDH